MTAKAPGQGHRDEPGPGSHAQSAGDWWLEGRSMSRPSFTDYLTRVIWHALDGVLREGGVVIDPHQPLGTVADLRLVARAAE